MHAKLTVGIPVQFSNQPALPAWNMRAIRNRISRAIAEDRGWKLFLLILLLLHVLPVWIFPYFPSQDGPSHVYNAAVLLQYFHHGNYQLRHFFDVQFSLAPNLTAQLLLPALMLVWSPLTAQRILISLIVVLLPLSVLYAGRHFDKRPTALLVGSFVFCYHNFLYMGFFANSLALPLCIFTVGYWLRIRSHITLQRLCVFFALGYLTFLTHFAPFGAMLAIILSILLYDLLRLLVHRLAGEKPAWPPAGITSLGQAVVQGFVVSPFFFLGLYVRTSASPGSELFKGTEYLIHYASNNLSLVSFTDSHLPVVSALWAVLCAAIVVNLGTRLIRRQYLSERDAVLASVALLAALYFSEPWAGLGSQWINERILLVAMVLAFLWFERLPRVFELIFGAVFAVIAVWQLLLLTDDHSRLQPELEELAMAADLVQPHSTLGYQTKGSYFYKLSDNTKYVSPMDHMAEYYALHKDVAFIGNYEANWAHFLVDWKNHPGPDFEPDYLLQSHFGPDEFDQATYDVIFRTPRVQLLHRKPSPPRLDAWAHLPDGRISLSLTFGTQDRELAGGRFEVSPQGLYANGGFGWAGAVRVFENGRDVTPDNPQTASVRSSDDAAFRVALPNGRYRVTLHFPADSAGSRQVNIMANDQVILADKVLDSADAAWEFSYEIIVSGQRLDQVFYTTWKKGNDLTRLPYWSLSGLEITSLEPTRAVPRQDLKPSAADLSAAASDLWASSDILKFDAVHISQAFATGMDAFGRDQVDPAEPLSDAGGAWQALDIFPDWNLDLDFSHYFGDTDFHTVYVACEIHSTANSRVRLDLGSDDGVTVWLNGTKLLQSLDPRVARPADDSVDLQLEKGRNLLLFRVNNVTGGWRLLATLK